MNPRIYIIQFDQPLDFTNRAKLPITYKSTRIYTVSMVIYNIKNLSIFYPLINYVMLNIKRIDNAIVWNTVRINN